MVRTILAGLGLLVLVSVAGCQNSSATAPSQPPTKALVATGNGGSVAVFYEAPDGSVQALTGPGATMCAQCKADAEKYFKTGELVGKCSVCGAVRTPVTLAPSTGHN